MQLNAPKRISAGRELAILLRQGYRALTGNKINLFISLMFPFMAAAITVWIAGENMFVNMESTKSACFILVCAAIWGGLFNSIQVIVKERKSIRRDYVSGALRIECYTTSRAIIQLFLCLFQSVVLTMTFYGIEIFHDNDLPANGIIFNSPMIEYFITIFLIVYAADTMGLCISCIVKNEQLASQMSPYILIVQLLFSGVLFEMKGFATNVSALMISRWGMEGLGSTSDLNSLPLRIQEQVPYIEHTAEDAFSNTTGHLLAVWGILLVFIIVPLIVGDMALHSVKNDRRG